MSVVVQAQVQEKATVGSPRALKIIAHRGASGLRPEHTLEAYQLAIEQGADFIEPDLVSTKDGVLIARHENEISGTTDVETKFPDRKVSKIIDGEKITGWFSEDFTWAEIQSLRAKERLDFRNQEFNFKFKIPRLEDILELLKKSSRPVGVYPEIKHSTYFKNIKLPMEDRLLSVLKEFGYDKKLNLVYIQSFEVSNLKYLKSKSSYNLVQLIGSPTESPFDDPKTTYKEMMTQKGLKEIATYAKGLGPQKSWLLDYSGQEPKDLGVVKLAHESGLEVHPYTFRNEDQFLPKPRQGRPDLEYKDYQKLGIDGLFSDFPGDARVHIRPTPEDKL